MGGTVPTKPLVELLDDAAALLRVLAAVEHAHLIGDEESVDTLLTQVTEPTVKGLAIELEVVAYRERVSKSLPRIGASTRAAPRDANVGYPADERPLAPVVPLDLARSIKENP